MVLPAEDVHLCTYEDVGDFFKMPKMFPEMTSSGIYSKVREVIDVDSHYYLVGGDYPRCSKCSNPTLLSCVRNRSLYTRSLFPI